MLMAVFQKRDKIVLYKDIPFTIPVKTGGKQEIL